MQHLFARILPIGLLAATLLVRCSAPEAPPSAAMAVPAPPASVPGINAPPYPTPKAIVSKTDLDSATNLFSYCVRIMGGEAMKDPYTDIPWDTIVKYLPAEQAGMDRAVGFHYGLVSPGWRMAWSYWYVDEAPVSPGGPHTLHAVDSMAHFYDAGTTTRMLIADWDRTYQNTSSADAYFARVEINHLVQSDSSDHWAQAQDSADVRTVFMPWEGQLELLHKDNADLIGSTELALLRARCTAEWRTDSIHTTPYVAHTLTNYLRVMDQSGQARDLVDDSTSVAGKPYRMRAANYATPCPHECGTVSIR
ncbi:MAG: hypothetical protein JNL05_08170 [Flavobacteriales bacterium]|nr:hypothetical protein [Flavobacteriales bacterium]